MATIDADMPLARQFRSYMSDGMSMRSHGTFCVEFYETVVKHAVVASELLALCKLAYG